MVCRNKDRAEAAKNEIIDQSKNQARSFTKCRKSVLSVAPLLGKMLSLDSFLTNCI